jgi:UDP-N-acetylmuramate dehydrogenase
MNMAETLRFQDLRGRLESGEPMSRHVSWRAGGAAARYYEPADIDDLSAFLRQLPADERVLFVGLGSNLLVRDGGFAGTVVLTSSGNVQPALVDGLIHADAGVPSPKVARLAAANGLVGAEFLASIPGTVGGALAMNAGCYGGECWEIVDRVVTIDRRGRLHERGKADFAIGYRHCELKSGGRIGETEWFVAATFRLPAGDGEGAQARIKEFLGRRIASQPLDLPNAGSVFRNPPGDHAARLVESCGLKGLTRGGASVSTKHANFIVNPERAASAADIEWLIETVRATVREKTGIDLHPEVRIVGEAAK